MNLETASITTRPSWWAARRSISNVICAVREFRPSALLGPLLSFMEIPMSDFSAGAPGARPGLVGGGPG